MSIRTIEVLGHRCSVETAIALAKMDLHRRIDKQCDEAKREFSRLAKNGKISAAKRFVPRPPRTMKERAGPVFWQQVSMMDQLAWQERMRDRSAAIMAMHHVREAHRLLRPYGVLPEIVVVSTAAPCPGGVVRLP